MICLLFTLKTTIRRPVRITHPELVHMLANVNTMQDYAGL